MFKIALCGDNSKDRQSLRKMIAETPGFRRNGDIDIVEYTCGKSLLSDIEEMKPDLIFLEASQDHPAEIETCIQLKARGIKKPLVLISTTAELAVDGYEIGVSGYLMKPIDPDSLTAVLKRLLTPRSLCRLMISRPGRRQYCEYNEITFLESSNKITLIHLINGECLTHRARLNDLEEALYDSRFLRCHQSYLVNMDFVKRVEQDFILENGNIVPIRVRSRRKIVAAYDFYISEHNI